MLVIHKSFPVEVVFTQAATVGMQINFPNINQLRDKFIVGIDVITQTQLAISVQGNTLVTLNQAAQILVTFQDVQNIQAIFQMPVTTMISGNNYGFIREIAKYPMIIEKCFITVTSVATAIAANTSIIFNMYYQDMNKAEVVQAYNKVAPRPR